MDGIIGVPFQVGVDFGVSGLSDVTLNAFSPSDAQTVSGGACAELENTGTYWFDFTADSKGTHRLFFQTASDDVSQNLVSSAVTVIDPADFDLSGTVSGAVGCTIAVYEDGTETGIFGVEYTVRQDGVLATWGKTGLDGTDSFSLLPGAYTVNLYKPPVGFDVESVTVSADGQVIPLYGSVPADVSDPIPSGICEIFERVKIENPDNIPRLAPQATAEITELPYESGGDYFSGQKITADFDKTTGELSWRIVHGATVEFTLPRDYGVSGTAVIPVSQRVRLKDLLNI